MIALPAGLLLLNKNDRLHRMEVARRYKAIKDAARLLCNNRRGRLPVLECVRIRAVIHPDVRTRRYDAHNFHLSVAAAVDGIVKNGLIPDDDVKHLPELTIVGGASVAGWQLVLEITELPETPATT